MPGSDSTGGGGFQPAFFEEADENDNGIEGTKVAASVAPGSPGRTVREKSNTRKTRSNRSAPDPRSPPASSDDGSVASSSGSGSGSGSSAADQSSHRKADTSRRRSTRDQPKSPTIKRVTYEESSSRHHKAAPEVHSSRSRRSMHQEDAAWYGRSPLDAGPMVMPGVSRPRAGTGETSYRHSSYHVNTASRPPLANTRYATHHHIVPNSIPPTMAGSFPPPMFPPQHPQPPLPQWTMPHLGQQMHPQAPPPMGDYFQPIRPLESRFESLSIGGGRPASSMGHRQTRYDDGRHDQENRTPSGAIQRRPSNKNSKREEHARLEDRMRMPPPPPRPHSTAPRHISTAPFRPPSRGPSDAQHNPFTPRTPTSAELEPFNYGTDHSRSGRRPSVSTRRPISQDYGVYHTEVATTKPDRNRRNSYYGGIAAENKMQDRMAQAHAYQHAREGEPAAPLTAEALRKAEKRSRPAPSSHSTRSSASREESDFVQRSATTRTTRYSDEGDDFTVRVVGPATLRMGGAELQCKDGAELNISRGGGVAIGEGSDRSSYIDPSDDRRISRPARPSTSYRPRASSQAGTFSRAGYDGYSEYDRSQASYHQHLPPLPPPPENSRNPYTHHYSYEQNNYT